MKMIQNKTLFLIVALGAICLAPAEASLPSTYVVPKAKQLWDRITLPGASLFNAQELSIDVGPTYTLPENTAIFEPGGGKGVWGLDLGSDYWIKKYAGLGVDTGITDTRQANDLIFSHLDVRGSLRAPLDFGSGNQFLAHFAAQASVGFGKDFQDGAYETTFQPALAVRFTPMIGLNGGYRRVFETDHNNNKGIWLVDIEVAF